MTPAPLLKPDFSIPPAANAPLLPEVGIIALVPDRWGPRWMVRHHVMARLGRFFTVAWLNPATHWRDFSKAKQFAEPDCQDVRYPGFFELNQDPWLPDFYRPRALARLVSRSRLIRARRALLARGCRKIVLYLWRPEFEWCLNAVPHDLNCYHLEDEYSFSRVERPIDPVEARLLTEADHVFILSPALFEKKGKLNPRSAFLPGGVEFDVFSKAMPEPADLLNIPRPRIGYVGSLKWQTDWKLLLALADRHPEWSFVFVGPASPHPEIESTLRRMKELPNTYFLGGKPTHEMAAYPGQFDVCIMPYTDDAYTRYVYPLKLHEYLASGRPVVGTPIPSLRSLAEVVMLAKDLDQWSLALTSALSSDENNEARRAARREVANRHDWNIMVDVIASRIAESLGIDFPRLGSGS